MKKQTKIGKQVKITIAVFFVLGAVFLGSQALSAGYEYTPMQPIPGTDVDLSKDFPSYVMAIYKFSIWTVGIAALLMVTIGGFMYFTAAGNTSNLGKAKTVITDALLGVVLALTAWLLLNTINPDLTRIDLSSLESIKIDKFELVSNKSEFEKEVFETDECCIISQNGKDFVSASYTNPMECEDNDGDWHSGDGKCKEVIQE